MPNATISIYFNDKDYPKYIRRKEELNAKVREIIKKEIKKNKDGLP